MKYSLIALMALFMLVPHLSGTAMRPSQPQPIDDVCQLYGAVYVEEISAFANYRVFVEENEAFAKLKVFKQDTEAFADRPGYWYFTDVKAFADFTIYIEKVQGFADFSIAYTNFRTSAGCN